MKRSLRMLSLMVALLILLSACSLPAGESGASKTETKPQGQTEEKTSAPNTNATQAGNTAAETAPETAPATAPSSTAEAQPSHTFSPLATENVLLPLETFSRERTQKPQFIMIHFTSAVVLNPNDPYNMTTVRKIFTDAEVSVHYIIPRDGKTECWMWEDVVAYHAGKGTFGGNDLYTDKMNDYAIGIELCAIGSQRDMAQYLTADQYAALDSSLIGFTDAQYAALKALVKELCARYDIPFDLGHIIGHEDYSSQKSDPGELFDWSRLFL